MCGLNMPLLLSGFPFSAREANHIAITATNATPQVRGATASAGYADAGEETGETPRRDGAPAERRLAAPAAERYRTLKVEPPSWRPSLEPSATYKHAYPVYT